MISLFFLGILSVYFVWDLYFSHCWYKGLDVSLDFVQDHVYAGGQVQMTERIENRKRMMLPVLEVAFRVRKELVFADYENTNVSDYTYKRDIFALLGNQRIIRTLTLNCAERGYYRIDQSHLTTFSLLYRRRFSRECMADTELYVYARRTDVSGIMADCVRMTGNVQCARMLCEDPFAYASIREYTPEDPMKTVNWKASAKTGNLMVNTFESTRMEKVMLYLDVEDKGILKYWDLIEESISVAASLAARMICKGMEVGICVNAGIREGMKQRQDQDATLPGERHLQYKTYIKPAGGRQQLAKIERMLAGCRPEEGTAAFADMLGKPEEDAAIIIISKNAAENREAIEKFVGKERKGIWVVPFPRAGEPEIRAAGSVCIIRREVERS